jgi:eukaryotic-like serine/threonine-protein kinase
LATEDEFDEELRDAGKRQVSAADSMTDRVLAAVFQPTDTPPRIARFEDLRYLGSGAMGAVYAAYDPELRRRVALKLLSSGLGSRGRRRRILEAEARALARLAHENVVRVFEIGRHAETLFVVMELVEGRDLRVWQEAISRPVRETVACYVQAARGLAAAHRAGLVHRDFKPANVLVGDDGVVRVADFGLAVSDDETEDVISLVSGDASDGSSSSPHAGTIGYMAPEQLAFGSVDSRSDQFSFCVALYQGVTGVFPYTPRQLLAMAEQGPFLAPAAGWSKLPRWLGAVLRRGLDPRVSARWPSMDALVEALVDTPKRRRRLVIGALAVIAVLGSAELIRRSRLPSCATPAVLGETWSPEVAARMTAASPGGPVFVERSLSLASARFDDYAEQWSTAYRDACRATWIAGTQTPRQLEGQFECLEVARRDLGTAIELLSAGSVPVLARSTEVVMRLPDPSSCLDADGKPASITERDQALDLASGRARILLAAGQPREALSVLDDQALSAADLGARAARAWLVRGEVLGELVRLPEAEDALQTSARLAFAADDPRTSLLVLQALGGFYGHALPDLGRAEFARTLMAGVGHRLELLAGDRAALALLEARIAGLRGNHALSIERHRAALDALAGSKDPLVLSLYRRRLGGALQAAGNLAEAADTYREIRNDLTALLGDSHPEIATIDRAQGSLSLEERNYDAARKYFEHSLTVQSDAYGEDWIGLALPMTVIAQVDLVERNFTAAEALASRAWALQQRLPLGHVDRGTALAVLAVVHTQLGDYHQGLAEHEQLLRELDGKMTQPERAAYELNTGWVLCRLDRCREARGHFERVAIETAEDDALRLHAESGLAQVELAENHPYAALERAERLATLKEVMHGDDPELPAEVLATLALARARTGADAQVVANAAGIAVRALQPLRPDDPRVAELNALTDRHERAAGPRRASD